MSIHLQLRMYSHQNISRGFFWHPQDLKKEDYENFYLPIEDARVSEYEIDYDNLFDVNF